MNRLLAAAIGLVMSLVPSIARSATVPAVAKALTLERLFQSPGLAGPAPRGVKLSPDGRLATLLRNRPDDRDRYDLWAIDTTTGAERMLIDSKKVGSGAELSEAEKMRQERLRIGGTKGIASYDWAPDGRGILVPIDGDLYMADLAGGTRRLTNTPATETEAKVAPKGGRLSFVRDQNVVVLDLATGSERVLTRDGAGTLSWGTAEFVAQEELNRFAGSWWSPDGRRIALQRTDESRVQVVRRAAIGADKTTIVEQRYPAAGSANARVELWLFDADGGASVKVDLGTDPDFYLARVNWAPDAKSLYVQRLSRDQTRLDMLRIDAATGAATLLFSETSPHWINLGDNFHALGDGSLIWGSERSGFLHLYRWRAGRWTQLTGIGNDKEGGGGTWQLMADSQSHSAGLVGVDEAQHRLFFTANKDDVLESHVYAIDYLHPGEPQRLTERGYWNEADMDAAASRLLVFRSSPEQPPQLYLADTAGRRIRWIAENAVAGDHPYAPYRAAHRPRTFGTIKAADGSDLHWMMIAPKLEPGRRYPVFMAHYGGPHSQTVSRGWGGRDALIAQYLASRGIIYFAIDNRGSPNRGRAFEDQIHRAMGTVEVEDQIAGARWLKAQPFADGAKIATYGWSYGGYMTLKLLETAPGLFAAGIAGAPVTRWELYDTAYTERYLGMPPYAASDALADAAKIRDPLLSIHGMADDNVVFENSTALWAELQAAKVPFEMMAYPGKTHGIAGEGAQTHVWETILGFLERRGVIAPPSGREREDADAPSRSDQR